MIVMSQPSPLRAPLPGDNLAAKMRGLPVATPRRSATKGRSASAATTPQNQEEQNYETP
jgi:hypothetical protein